MKRCPECRRDYYDDSLAYCLDDGALLLEGPATANNRTLVIPQSASDLHAFASRADFPTQILSAHPTFASPPPTSIAVLPFVNIGNDPDVEYFSDGLAEELLTVLSKIRDLRVAARTSSFSFKGKPSTVSEIGHALHVGTVVEGSIRMSGSRMRIAVQLVKVEDGYHLWSSKYDRKMDDIFAVQDDIAQSVVEELRTLLVGDDAAQDIETQVLKEVAQATKDRSANPEAQRLMLLGRYFLDRTTREASGRAIENFKNAVALDPNFALCWAELGRAYSVQAGKSWVSIDDGFKLSREATERALELEPELAEGHAQLGRIRAVYEWDLRGALDAYSRALDFAPGSPTVMDGASVLEFKLGRFDRALELSRRVLTQDPLSAAVWHNLGLICHAAGLLAESEKAFRRALDLSPQRLVTRAMLAMVLADEGRASESREVADSEPDAFWRHWSLAIVHSVNGEVEQADAALESVLGEHEDGDAYQIAEIYAVRGEIDKAFEWLERAVEYRDTGVTHARVSPRFRLMHADARWPTFLKTIGFD
ncbi:MAG TPA: tetratricopeptide repeat protein [Pyrinomonadaceae bacterium]|nr:tetratricopeptide repeat protein [Pyrinomonadaceae bacterium]